MDIHLHIKTCDCTRQLYAWRLRTWRFYMCKCIWLYVNVFGRGDSGDVYLHMSHGTQMNESWHTNE